MRVFIAGIDGYLGWSLAKYLTVRGHQVGGMDLFLRRTWVEEMGSCSAIPIASIGDRLGAFRDTFGTDVCFYEGDLCESEVVNRALSEFVPEAIVHLGECPSAPYSMIDANHTKFVQTNNIVSTFNLLFGINRFCPTAHLVKLGTMGEYGTPNIDIPEGFFDITFRGRRERLPFPRMAGSWYHWSKVHGSNNVMFACRLHGLRATDVMQGVVYGLRSSNIEQDPRLATRLDFDEAFGTVINRFCCQAVIGHKLTPYGNGHQKRGFIPLRDSMQCLTLAIENPPDGGEYRVFNQFEGVYEIAELARKVQKAAQTLGINVDIQNIENPRQEMQDHHYNPDHQHLRDLGYRPTQDIDAEIVSMLSDLLPHRERIQSKSAVLAPSIQWQRRGGTSAISLELTNVS